ncbi:MAG: hypothetical protein BWX80_04091 [Candidatus Hydrogenedentes bacterium ADurb.Bin101]|nr:MAG: hypothetical protein BWX80_04091 [Candidatus Hydrogenedentes bacterium ADurb.Bin101]
MAVWEYKETLLTAPVSGRLMRIPLMNDFCDKATRTTGRELVLACCVPKWAYPCSGTPATLKMFFSVFVVNATVPTRVGVLLPLPRVTLTTRPGLLYVPNHARLAAVSATAAHSPPSPLFNVSASTRTGGLFPSPKATFTIFPGVVLVPK